MNEKEVLELIKTRRSIRKYFDKPIPEKDLRDLVEAGIYAPTGSNTQNFRFIIITNKEDIIFLAHAKRLRFMRKSTAIIFCYADLTVCPYMYGDRKEQFKLLPTQDVAMAMQNIILLAHAKNIASCMVQFSEKTPMAKQIKARFGLKNTDELQGMIVMGYSDKKINMERYTHATRKVQRKNLDFYIKDWRK